MNTSSFTDEQLLNLVNNTIETKTEFTRNEFTGGAVIITTTHNNTIKKFKVSLYFGYKGKHSVNRQIEISKDSYFIWTKAILIKVFSLDMINIGMDLNELNLLMNSNSNRVDSNLSISIDSGDTPVPTTVHKEYTSDKGFSLSRDTHIDNVSEEYFANLQAYLKKHIEIVAMKRINAGSILPEPMSFDEFISQLRSKASYKYKNFVLAYKNWLRSDADKRLSK